jgi:hypothetical protein
VHVGKHLSEVFPIGNDLKEGDALLALRFTFALENTVSRVQANQEGLKLNGRHQLLIYADGVNIFSGSKQTVQKSTQASVVASKETDVEENMKKTKYMVMSQDQHAEQNHNLKIGNKSFERVVKFIYLGMTLTSLFMEKLRAGSNQGMLTVVWCRILCLLVHYSKIQK